MRYAIALLALMLALQVSSVVLESQTFDEGLHLVAGFSYYKTGDYRLNREHPPLAKLLAALPLLFTPLEMPDQPEAWENRDQMTLSGYLLYRSPLSVDTILLLGRSVTILFSALLGLAIWLHARRYWGVGAALIALAFYVTDPNFIAHGRYITSDVAVSLAIFVSAISWKYGLDTRTRRAYLLASLALGLALAIKFSAMFLLPVHLLLAAVYAVRNKSFKPIGAWCAVAAGGVVLLLASYGPETIKVLRGQQESALADHIPEGTALGKKLHRYSEMLQLPAHPLLIGMWLLVEHNDYGHPSYMLGEIREQGFRWYFPFAFAVKTPTATLLFLLIGLVLAIRFRHFPLLLLYPAIYFLLSVSSKIDIGVRHLLPIYPFLFVWAASLFVRLPKRALIVTGALLASIQVFEWSRIQPDYLAFFNTPAGGPENGSHLLLDSNLDWGQDLKKLGVWMKRRGIDEVCLSYFGTGDPYTYGVLQIPLLPDPPEKFDCIAAISVNNLHDLYTPPDKHAWARKLTPIGDIGRSIFLYDLRKGSSKRPAWLK